MLIQIQYFCCYESSMFRQKKTVYLRNILTEYFKNLGINEKFQLRHASEVTVFKLLSNYRASKHEASTVTPGGF